MHIEFEYTTFLLQNLQFYPNLIKNYFGSSSFYFYDELNDNIDNPKENIFIYWKILLIIISSKNL